LVRMVPMPDPEERPDLQQVHARVFFFCGQCTTRRERERERKREREEKAHRTSPHRLHLFHNSKFARGSRA
jgi:hypothetical protein